MKFTDIERNEIQTILYGYDCEYIPQLKDATDKIFNYLQEKVSQVEPEVKPACDICDLKRFCKIYQLWVSEEADYFNKDRDDFYCKHFESGKNTGKIAGM